MTESILDIDIRSVPGVQLVLLGVLMLAVGIWMGTAWLGKAAWGTIVNQTPPTVVPPVPEYLQMAGAINMWAVAVSVACMAGLIGLDWWFANA